MVFNTDFDWSTYAGPWREGVNEFHRVALHEFGHVLGLDHPDEYGQVVSAVMSISRRAADLDRLQADDVAGDSRHLWRGGWGAERARGLLSGLWAV